MFQLTILLTIAIIALDIVAVRRLTRQSHYRSLWVAAAVAADIVPIAISMGVLMTARDNTTAVMMTSAWAFFAYMVLCVARIPLNIAIVCSKRRWVRLGGAAITAVTVIVLFYGMLVTRTDYHITHHTIYSERLPQAFDGYKIVQLSDIHIGTMLSPEEELTEIVRLCNAEDADMVAFCGDLVNVSYDELKSEYAAILAQLKARDGVYSVTGNHDTGIYMRARGISVEENTSRLISRQQQMGWKTLEDSTLHIHRSGDSIALTGVAFSDKLQAFRHSFDLPYIDLKEAYEATDGTPFNITISHIPQTWDSILQDSLADLTLSGHVHAMQLKLPIGRRGLSPAMFGYKRWSGLYHEQGRYLYINDGIGNVLFPLRVGAKPEITVITIKCQE